MERLQYNTFLLNNYLLKCAHHMLDVFSNEILSIHNKILIGLKDQFDLHKFLQIFYENRTCTLRLVFLLIFLVEDWIWKIKEVEYLVRHFQSNGVYNPWVDWVLSRVNLFLIKNNLMFFIFLDIFCYFKILLFDLVEVVC